jgi:hypothetical protein
LQSVCDFIVADGDRQVHPAVSRRNLAVYVLSTKDGFAGIAAAMALTYPPFAQSARIRAAAENAPPFNRWDAHKDGVRIVQRALSDLGFGHLMPKTFSGGQPDGSYGDETVAAVRAFQQKYPPLRVDGSVGKNTLAKMDSLLAKTPPPSPAPKPGPVPPGPPSGGLRVQPQPPGEEFLLANVFDNDGQGGRPLKSDLDSASRQLNSSSNVARLRVWAAKLGLGAAALDVLEREVPPTLVLPGARMATLMAKLAKALVDEGGSALEIKMSDLQNFPQVDTSRKLTERAVRVNQTLLRNEMTVGGQTALRLFDRWTRYSGAPTPAVDVSADGLGAATAGSNGFLQAAQGYERQLLANLQAQARLGLVDYRDLVTGPGPTRGDRDSSPNEPGRQTGRILPATEAMIPQNSIIRDTVVKICIGSFQGMSVLLSDFKVSGRAVSGRLTYRLRDHFGVDDDDCEVAAKGIHGTPGQVAMWVLQHFAPVGHKPFVDQVTVVRQFTGAL